jgi:hypothetical protein
MIRFTMPNKTQKLRRSYTQKLSIVVLAVSMLLSLPFGTAQADEYPPQPTTIETVPETETDPPRRFVINGPATVEIPHPTAGPVETAPVTVPLAPATRIGEQTQTQTPIAPPTTVAVDEFPGIPSSFNYQDCSWLGPELISRNVRSDVASWLVAIAMRESGCCPNVRGGDVVDADCNVLKVIRFNHRSDTGVFQLNGAHWKGGNTYFCANWGICDQESILMDIDLQIRMMLNLYSRCGERPWIAPNYGCSPRNPYNEFDNLVLVMSQQDLDDRAYFLIRFVK